MEESLFVSPLRQQSRNHANEDLDSSYSSPLRHSSERSGLSRSRLKRPPTVTPKRFTKFFTPRDSLSTRTARQSKAGRQLRDITKNGRNSRPNLRASQDIKQSRDDVNEALLKPAKRRKISFEVCSSPPQSSPLKRVQVAEQGSVLEDPLDSPDLSDDDSILDILDDSKPFPQKVRRLRNTGRTQRLLQRSFGGFGTTGRGWKGADHGLHWQADTANFVVEPHDSHSFPANGLPFCAESCNTNSLVAIGEEEGRIRLIDSSSTSNFLTPHLTFKLHSNAIVDLAFSSDDYLLATASCDQKSHIIEMQTQRVVCVLDGHRSSVKQVRFHPNDQNMITTSGRDGSVMIWDLRCGGRDFVQSLQTSSGQTETSGRTREPKHVLDVGNAFRQRDPNVLPSTFTRHVDKAGVSITSIQHLNHGREHLLLTTSETNASIKLWDLRQASRRGGLSTPASNVPPPPSHQRTRNYGVNAMMLSSDGARVYTSCRDSVVYAYSTSHLVLGQASDTIRGPRTSSKSGTGPLYGFRNPAFRAASFYVNAAIRTARADNNEIIAVGSSDGTPVLFPTDERYIVHRRNDLDEEDDDLLPTSSPPVDDIPIYEHGTALAQGHNREVTSMTWTHDGELVTVSDDFTARCWRENAEKARFLRSSARGEEKWRCGWPNIESSWDEDDG